MTSGTAAGGMDLQYLGRFLESMRTFTEDLIFAGSGTSLPIFHYTDLAGLKGIAAGNDLWLTNARYSNDDEEMTHGLRVAVRVVAEKRKEAAADPARAAYLDRVAALLESPAAAGVYICCFCLKDDLLSQWRGYGANGAGVSIEFPSPMFAFITGPDSPHGGLMRLWKVNYKEDTQRWLVEQALEFAYLDPAAAGNPVTMAVNAHHAIQFFIPTFKNAGFEEENECRLIFTPAANCPVPVEFRVSRGLLVPYYSLKALGGPGYGPLPIAGVRIGPSANKDLNVESARMLLAQSGHPAVPVVASDTPFRG